MEFIMKMKTIIAVAAAVGAVTALAVTIVVKKRKELGFCCDPEDFDDFEDYEDYCGCCCGDEGDLDIEIPSEDIDDSDADLASFEDNDGVAEDFDKESDKE